MTLGNMRELACARGDLRLRDFPKTLTCINASLR